MTGPVDAAACPAAGLDADNPCIQYMGRWDHSNPKQAVAKWGAVAMTAAFQGTSCTLRLVDGQETPTNLNAGDIPGTGNTYQVSIDGGAFTLVPSTNATTYPVATGLAAGTHTITLVRRTESKFGTTTFVGFTLDSGASLVLPPAAPTRKIEILGDSISAGLADDQTADPSGGWNNVTSNGYMAFGPQLARMLNAEWHVEARGGSAIYGYPKILPWFDRTFGPDVAVDGETVDPMDPAWDFGQWQPDVFVLALGTNDWSATYTPDQGFVAFYQSFLMQLRGWYPSTEIFCLAPFQDAAQTAPGDPSGGAPWDDARQRIAQAVMQFGDAHVHAIIPVQGNAASGYSGEWLTHPDDYVPGDYTHPTVGGDTKIATHLADIIRPIMSW